MTYKLYNEGNYTIVEDLNGVAQFENPIGDTEGEVKGTDLILRYGSGGSRYKRFPVSAITDINDVSMSESEIITWVRKYTGFNTASGGSGALTENSSLPEVYAIDWEYDTFNLVMFDDGCVFSEINLPDTDVTKVITIYLTGAYVPIFPASWTVNNTIVGTYDGVKNNQITVEYIKPNYYWVVISQDT